MKVEEAFGYVLFGVVVIGALVAVFTFIGTGETYKQIGRGGLSLNEDDDGRGKDRPHAGAVSASSAAEREVEIRQLLEARNVRRERRGQAPLDVEEELRRLDRPSGAVDPALEAEIREMVVARNARRVARGREPLDVEAEVARQLRELA